MLRDVDINGLTPNGKLPRRLYLVIGEQGELVLSNEQPTSGRGWAIRLTEVGELKRLRDAVDQAINLAE